MTTVEEKLIGAARFGYAAIVSMLLSAGADPDSVNSTELTPLAVALQEPHLEVARTLNRFAARRKEP